MYRMAISIENHQDPRCCLVLVPQIMHSSVNMPRALPIAGFSLIMIQQALSSHISVAPTCRKLKPRSSTRR